MGERFVRWTLGEGSFKRICEDRLPDGRSGEERELVTAATQMSNIAAILKEEPSMPLEELIRVVKSSNETKTILNGRIDFAAEQALPDPIVEDGSGVDMMLVTHFTSNSTIVSIFESIALCAEGIK